MGQAEDILKSLKKEESRKGQGKLKIFIGMVAGVGKTYAMLKAAHQLKGNKVDVIVGYIETHGRKETEEQIVGLDLLPRKKISYKEVTLEEFDIDALLERKPKIVLIDELAHTNAPGSRHQKRWQDVIEILGQGIDVYTTLNVQHVESRADTIAGLTGIRIHELVPDSVIDRADEIVVIDLIPDELVDRLKTGKIYPADKIDAATTNFFKVSNLTALREISLRLMAERVDHELKDMTLIQGVGVSWKTNHKVMVAIFGSPYSESLIRYTRKLAYGLNCEWVAAHINTDRVFTEKERELLSKNIELVKQLGGEVVSTQNDSVSDGLLSLAHIHGITQIVVGKSERRSLISFFVKNTLPYQLIKKSNGIDINVISPVQKATILKGAPVKEKADFDIDWRSLLSTTGFVANITIINAILLPLIHYRSIGMIYLMGIFIGSLVIKNYNVLFAAILGGICWNIFFLPPTFTFVVNHHEDWMMLLLYIVAGIVIGIFTNRLKKKEHILRTEGERATQLYNITKSLSKTKDIKQLIEVAGDELRKILQTKVSFFIRPPDMTDYDPSLKDCNGDFDVPPKEEYALDWVAKNKTPAGKFTDTLPSSSGYYLPLIGRKDCIGIIAIDASNIPVLSYDLKLIMDAVARQLSVGVDREQLQEELRTRMVHKESERIYKTLLNSVSHEMRTPLATIKGFSSALRNPELSKDSGKVMEMAGEITQGVERLDYVVQNLLDMSRLESGNLKLHLDYVDIVELINSAIHKVQKYFGEKKIIVSADKELPYFYLDYFLIEQTVENIIRNAYVYTPSEALIEIEVSVDQKYLNIEITDNGPGIQSSDPMKVFDKFFREAPQKTGGVGLGLSICKSIVEQHHGIMSAENARGKGARFKIRLPKELDREILFHE